MPSITGTLTGIFLLFALTFCHAQNLVVNGSFADGSLGWDSLLVSGPAQATKTIQNSVYQISIDTPGTESWHVQLKQKGIALDSGAVYEFSFEAWAGAGRNIEASVGMENGPYTFYTPANGLLFSLETEKQRFSVRFRMNEKTDSNARVQFNCGLVAGDLYLSGVSIEKITTPMLVLLSPGGGEVWSSATVHNIEWLGIGMDTVALTYSLDAGLTWEPVCSNAPNSGAFSWKVPAATSPWCLVRVTDPVNAGLADTSENSFEIGSFFNLIQNGAFSNSALSPWNDLGVYGPAVASGGIGNGAYTMVITTAGSENWNVQFTQSGIPLVQGETYVFSFTAWADAGRPFQANIGQDGGAYESYLDDTTKGMVVLTTEPQDYSLEFVMAKPTDTNARLEFNAGTATGTVSIDNIFLYRKRAMRVLGRPAGRDDPQMTGAAFSFKNGAWLLSSRSEPSQVRIFDIRGKSLKTIISTAGEIRWNGRSDAGVTLAPGTYLVQVRFRTGRHLFPLVIPGR